MSTTPVPDTDRIALLDRAENLPAVAALRALSTNDSTSPRTAESSTSGAEPAAPSLN